MAFHLYEDTWETTATFGTGDYALGGAVAGWRAFSAQYADGDTTWYSAFDGVNFEHGIATYHAPPTNTLTRGTVLRSTNGGAAVAWGAGVKQITVAPLGAVLEKLAPPISAQLLDLDTTRLAAVGTKLKGLGTVNFLNQPTASPALALDGAFNSYNGPTAPFTWNLPTGAKQYLTIALGAQSAATGAHTIVPGGADIIFVGVSQFTNAHPLVIPALPNGILKSLTLMGDGGGNWLVVSVSPEIAEAMGWVTRPCLAASYNGGNATTVTGIWSKVGLAPYNDSHGWWSVNGYNPKRAGRYSVTWSCHLGDATNTPSVGSCAAGIYVNGGLWDWRGVYQFPGQALPAVNFCTINAIINMNGTTDYIEPWVQVAATTPTFYGNSHPNGLDIFYLGA